MRPEDQPRGGTTVWTRALTALLAIVAMVAVIDQLNDRAPHQELDAPVPAGGDVSGQETEIVDCQRRGPEVPATVSAFPGRPGDPPRVTSTGVVACPVRYDGHRVEFVGEVVGDVLRRDGGAWVLMNDDAYALETGPLPSHQDFAGSNSGLAVWLDGDLAKKAQTAGGPGVRGDVLRVEGVIHRADPADGGGLTLRANRGTVVAEAVRVPQPVHKSQAVAALLTALGALAMVAAERFVARNR